MRPEQTWAALVAFGQAEQSRIGGHLDRSHVSQPPPRRPNFTIVSATEVAIDAGADRPSNSAGARSTRSATEKRPAAVRTRSSLRLQPEYKPTSLPPTWNTPPVKGQSTVARYATKGETLPGWNRSNDSSAGGPTSIPDAGCLQGQTGPCERCETVRARTPYRPSSIASTSVIAAIPAFAAL